MFWIRLAITLYKTPIFKACSKTPEILPEDSSSVSDLTQRAIKHFCILSSTQQFNLIMYFTYFIRKLEASPIARLWSCLLDTECLHKHRSANMQCSLLLWYSLKLTVKQSAWRGHSQLLRQLIHYFYRIYWIYLEYALIIKIEEINISQCNSDCQTNPQSSCKPFHFLGLSCATLLT